MCPPEANSIGTAALVMAVVVGWSCKARQGCLDLVQGTAKKGFHRP